MTESSPGFLGKITEHLRRPRTSGASFTSGNASPAPSSSSPLPPGVYLATQTSEEREELLNTLADVYFQKDGDCLDFELASLPVAVTAAELEATAEDRTIALEAVSEKLSHHILRNYDAFSSGVDEVISAEELLVAAALKSKISRERLSVAAAEVQRGIGVGRNTQRKRGLTELLDILYLLRRARELALQLSTCLSNGDFCTALYFSEQLAEAAEALGPDLELANTLQIKACAGIEDSYSQIKVTVTALTSDFQSHAFEKVLQGYALLASSSNFSIEIDPGGDVRAAFSAAPGAAAQKVLRGVLLARAGLEEKAAEAESLAAFVALLPSDLFRTCVARVMMVFWDLLAAHHAMMNWNSIHTSNFTSVDAENEKNSAIDGDENNITVDADDASVALKEQIEAIYAAISSGLSSSRRVLWDECSRALGTLISTPAAIETEHFMHVVKWTQRLIAAGESFTGVEATALRAVVHRQAGNYFKNYHESNIEALNSMLNKEMWKRLPITELPPLLLSIEESQTDSSSSSLDNAVFSSASLPEFSSLVVQGNPWYTTRGTSFSSPRASLLLPPVDGNGENGDKDGGHVFNSIRTSDNIPLDSRTDNTNTTSSPKNLLHQQQITVTNSSWRMAKWMKDYVSLINTLPQLSTTIFNGMTELVDLYLLHIYLDFGDGALLLGGGGSNSSVSSNISSMNANGSGPITTNITIPSMNSSSGSIFTGGGGGGESSINTSTPTSAPPAPTTTSLPLLGSSGEYLTPRLRTTLQHIALGSMSKHRAVLMAGSNVDSKLARALAHHHHQHQLNNIVSSKGGSDHALHTTSMTNSRPSSSSGITNTTTTTSPSNHPHHISPVGGAAAAASTEMNLILSNGVGNQTKQTASPSTNPLPTHSQSNRTNISSIAHSSNLYGLLERHTAGESLLSISRHLSHPQTLRHLESVLPEDDRISVSLYCDRTLGASQDLYDCIMVQGCRLMLPLYWIPDAVSAAGGSEYQAAEPPAEAAPWANQLKRQLELFGAQLNQAEGMVSTPLSVPTTTTTTTEAVGTSSPSLSPPPSVLFSEMWHIASSLLTDSVLEGFSRVKKCTLEGRSAMSADLQAVRHALPRQHWDVLRKADDYVKAFYIPLPELATWAEQHPGYSEQQVMALAHCIGESSGLKKKDLQAAMVQVEAGLKKNLSGGGTGGSKAVY